MASQTVTPVCKECKRMKLRCDKKVPCSTCVRRGCEDICPHGTLVPGKGTRYILDGTQQLHSEIQKLQARILQLEEALTSVYAQVSDKPHPLLSGRREPPHEFASSSIQATEVESVQDALDALGTLAIGDLGQAKYFGPSAGTETLFQYSKAADELTSPSNQVNLETHFLQQSYQFPFKLGLDNHSLLHEVISQFPERLRASSLCESYAEQFAWSFAPVLREELIDDFLAPTYKLLEAIKEFPEKAQNVLRPHRCAVLFLVFALGTWVDLTLDDYWMDADKFYHIARVCLSMQSIFEAPECATVQAIYLLSGYSEVRGHSTFMTLHPGWTLLSVASKIAQSLGLHRDVSKWNYLDSKTLDQRRHLFWDLATNEAHFSMGLGRPPSIRNSYIDAQVAADSGMIDSNGRPLQGYFNWKHQFARDILFDVLETRLAVVPPSYEIILTLDRRIMEIPIPQHLNTLSFEDIDETRPPNRILQSGLPGLLRSALIISLHRTHFSQSLLDPSKNPLISPFAPSFLASYRAASWIIQCQRVFYLKYSDLMHRLWHPWTHALSACFILGCIVIHVPSSPIAENAFQDLNAMCDLYEIAASKTISLRTKNGWKIVQKIQARAKESYNRHKNANIDVMTNPPFPPSNSGDDELALFGGQTRTIVAESSPTSTPLLRQTSALHTQSFEGGEDVKIDVHPSLLQFLDAAPVTQLASFNDVDSELTPIQYTTGTSSFDFTFPKNAAPQPSSMFPTTQLDAHFGQFNDFVHATEFDVENELRGVEYEWQSFLRKLDFVSDNME